MHIFEQYLLFGRMVYLRTVYYLYNTINENTVLFTREISARIPSQLNFPSEQIFCRADP